MYGYCDVIANDIGPWIHILLKSITCSHACDVTAYTIFVTCPYLQLFIVYNINMKNKNIFFKSIWFSLLTTRSLLHMCCYNVMLCKTKKPKTNYNTHRLSWAFSPSPQFEKKNTLSFLIHILQWRRQLNANLKLKWTNECPKKLINCCNGFTVD